MHSQAIALAAALMMMPLSVSAADLVVWWQEGYYAQEDEAVREIIAAFEQNTGKQVELVQFPEGELFDRGQAAVAAGQPPDFLFGDVVWWEQWANEDYLVDLEDALGPVLDLFDPDTIKAATLLNGKVGRRGLYGLPMGRRSNHIHVWNDLLERAGLTRDDIPAAWDAFWSFWCDEVQPAVREALGRDDIWGVGLAMSLSSDAGNQFQQFQQAYEASWIDSDRRLRVDDPAVRAGMIQALQDYTEIWRKGCTPPESVDWTNAGNNEAFLSQQVMMTPNGTLSIPAALKRERHDDYYKNAITIDWPDGAHGQPLVIDGGLVLAVVFAAGENGETATQFVRFLAEEGWLAHWAAFAGDRWFPPMQGLLETPFWLDASDPHRLRASIQILTREHAYSGLGVRDRELQSTRILEERVMANAVHRVVTEGITSQQAVDDAIARIKEILGE